MAEAEARPPSVPASVRHRITGTLFASQSLFSAAQIASFTLLPIIAVTLGGSDSAAGIPATIALLGRAVAAYPIGWLMDRIGRRNGLALGYLIAAAGSVLSALAVGWGSFFGFCAGAGLGGMGRGTSDQARFAAAEVQPPSRRAKAIGWIVFASTVGAIAGPLLVAPSGRLAVRAGLDPNMGPYIIAAVLTYLAMMLCFMFLRPDPMLVGRAIALESHTEEADAVARPVRSILAKAPVRLAIVAMVIGQLVMTLLMVITPLHMKYLGMETQDVSWVIMAHTLGMFGLASVTGWLIDRAGRVAMIAAGALLLVMAGIIAPVANSVVVLAFALFVLGLGWNFSFIAGSSLLSGALASSERGQVQGANETMVALAAGTASLTTGTLYALGGMVLIGAVGVVFALLLIFAVLLYSRSQPTTDPLPEV